MQLDIVRAWKDEEYRESLTAAQQETLPENPASEIELSDEELGQVDGAAMTTGTITWTIEVVSKLFC